MSGLRSRHRVPDTRLPHSTAFAAEHLRPSRILGILCVKICLRLRKNL